MENFLKDIIPDSLDLSQYYQKLQSHLGAKYTSVGRVKQITGLIIRAHLPNAKIGELCRIIPNDSQQVFAEVVGFDDEDVFLTPLDKVEAIGPKTTVINRGETLKVAVGDQLLGRIVDSLGKPVDGGAALSEEVFYPVHRAAPRALDRERITEMLPVGVRAIDSLFSIGEGQRVGVFSSAGVGKSSLIGMIARNSKADINVVALVGERGREVQEFLHDNLGVEGLKKTVVVVSTSDDTALRRILAGYTATAIAEYFRDQGKKVMLLMDSVTRFARALREIALSVGEPPIRQGYPPSVFSILPGLFERAGKTRTGSITGLYTILLSSEQIEDPLGEEIRAIVDGHLYLTSKLAQLQHYPAIDLLKSNSRVMEKVISAEHNEVAKKIRQLWSVYEDNRDLISIGAYKKGSDAMIDEAIQKRKAIEKFLIQGHDEKDNLDLTLERARQAVR